MFTPLKPVSFPLSLSSHQTIYSLEKDKHNLGRCIVKEKITTDKIHIVNTDKVQKVWVPFVFLYDF